MVGSEAWVALEGLEDAEAHLVRVGVRVRFRVRVRVRVRFRVRVKVRIGARNRVS